MDNEAIRARIRHMIDTGVLPCERPGTLWAGRGVGDTCVVCSETIEATEVEYEIEFKMGQVFRVHPVCHRLWVEECKLAPGFAED